MADLPPLRDIIAEHGLRQKKSLGQHFLLDENLTQKIVRMAGDLAGQHVIEIGPGPGGLTRALLTCNAETITVIEKDTRAIPALETLIPHSDNRLRIVEQDALEADLLSLCNAPRSIIANLPYNVGTEMLLGWLYQLAEDSSAYRSFTLMFQQEVGERITAQPGSKAYGRLSVLAQWLCDAQLVMKVPASAFVPPPKVDSVIVQLIPRAEPLEADRVKLETVLRTAFQQRRKMLRSALKPLGLVSQLSELAIDETLRPDQLTVEQYVALANVFTHTTR